MLKNPWIVGIAVYFITVTILGSIEGPTVCSDGWASGSIGRQGACSHHGGVQGRWSPTLSLIIAITIGSIVSVKNNH